jgi:hypothetical protein
VQNKKAFAISLVVLITALACSVQVTLPDSEITTGPTVEEEINIPAIDAESVHSLRLDMGAAEVDITPGGGGAVVQGVIAYNVDELDPVIVIEGQNIQISQDDPDFDFPLFAGIGDLENHWDLRLGAFPLDLEINIGATESDFELGGLAIQNLSIFGGASDMRLAFSEPNLIEMDTLRVNIGAADFHAEGLANANFSTMEFEGGAGGYSLDFSGSLQRDASVDINLGFSELVIIVPDELPVTLRITGGLTNATFHGNWDQSGSTYTQEGEGPTLTIYIEMGAGDLSVRN